MNILIVDDDHSLCAALSAVLLHAGHEVECVHDAAHACAALDTGRFHMVISDWMMPGNGHTVVSYVRRRLRNVPVIVLSGKLPPGQALRDGAPVVAQLQKPVEARTLLATVRDASGGAELASEI